MSTAITPGPSGHGLLLVDCLPHLVAGPGHGHKTVPCDSEALGSIVGNNRYTATARRNTRVPRTALTPIAARPA